MGAALIESAESVQLSFLTVFGELILVYILCCSDFTKMLLCLCWILKNCTTFGGLDTHKESE